MSTLTVGEVLVKPIETGNRTLEAQYRSLFDDPGALVLPFDRKAGEFFALIRQNRAIKAPDAIQLATGASVGCDLFASPTTNGWQRWLCPAFNSSSRWIARRFRPIQFIMEL